MALVAALLVAAGVSALVAGDRGAAQGGGDPPYVAGKRLRQPPVIRSSHGVLRTRLVARNGTVTVSGVPIANTQTYAAHRSQRALLGPTLHVNPGDTIDITLVNRLRKPVNVKRKGGQPADNTCPPPGDMMHMGPVHGSPHGQITNLHFHGLHVTPL